MRAPLIILPLLFTLIAVVAAVLPVSRPVPVAVTVAASRPATTVEIADAADPPRISPVSVCDAVDDSGSQAANDPQDQRDAAVGRTLDFLAALDPPSGDNRVGVVRFGSTATVRLPLTSVTATTPAIRAALQAGEFLGNTNFPDAVLACQRMLAGAAKPVIFLISDGLPDLGDGRGTDALFADIATAIRGLSGIPVHVLLTVPGGVPAWVSAAWTSAGAASVTDLGTAPGWEDQLTRQLIIELGSTIGVLPRPLGTLDAEHPSLPVDVPAYTPRLTVTGFAPGAQPRLSLVDPHGRTVRTVAGGIGVLTVDRPAPGRWQVRGQLPSGAVTVQADVTPLQVRLVAPVSDPAVGRPITVTAAVGDARRLGDGAAPLYVGAVVVQGRRTYELQLHPGPDGLWHSSDAAPAAGPGPVTVRLVLKIGTDTVLDSTTRQLALVSRPYLVADPPVVTSAPGGRYGWRLYQDGRRTSDSPLGEDPAAAVVVRQGGRPAVRADYDGGGHWSIPVSALRSGGTVTAELSSRSTAGTPVTDAVTSAPVVVRPAAAVRLDRVLGALVVAVACALAGWLAWVLAATCNPLEGHLRPVGGGVPGRPVRVRRRRWQRLPRTASAPRVVIWSQGGRLRERAGWVPWPLDARPAAYDAVPPARRPGTPAPAPRARTAAPAPRPRAGRST